MQNKRDLNPAIPRRLDVNYADCNSCANKSGIAAGMHCVEYATEPNFHCQKYVGKDYEVVHMHRRPSTGLR